MTTDDVAFYGGMALFVVGAAAAVWCVLRYRAERHAWAPERYQLADLARLHETTTRRTRP